MATTREDIRAWLERGKTEGATHMIVACDTFDHEDYPVFVKPGQDVRKVYAEYNGPQMQRVMECYSYAMPLEEQISAGRVFNFD